MGCREDQVRRHALGQDMAEHQALVRGADAACGLDILHLLERQHDRADDAPAERNARNGNRDDDGREAAAQRHGDGHGQDQVGKGLQELDDPLAHHVETAAEIAAGQPPQRPDRRAEQHRAERHSERRLAAVDDAAQRVAADLVGTEPVLLVGRLLHRTKVGLERWIGRDHGCRDGHGDDQGCHHAPEGRERRAAKERPEGAQGRSQARWLGGN